MSDFDTLTKIIQERRSVFPPMYEQKEISDDTIKAILENGNWAPTHKKTEPWRYKVIKGARLDDLAQFLANYYKKNTSEEDFSLKKYEKTLAKPKKSAAIIAICMARDPKESIPEWEEIASVACSVQNIWLSCTSLGIGSYWSSPKAIHEMDDFLGLKENERCLGLFYMGYMKDAIYSSERSEIHEKIEWL